MQTGSTENETNQKCSNFSTLFSTKLHQKHGEPCLETRLQCLTKLKVCLWLEAESTHGAVHSDTTSHLHFTADCWWITAGWCLLLLFCFSSVSASSLFFPEAQSEHVALAVSVLTGGSVWSFLPHWGNQRLLLILFFAETRFICGPRAACPPVWNGLGSLHTPTSVRLSPLTHTTAWCSCPHPWAQRGGKRRGNWSGVNYSWAWSHIFSSFVGKTIILHFLKTND